MGCASSEQAQAEMKEAIHQQTLKLEKLKRENEEIRRMVKGLASAQESAQTQKSADLEEQLLRLESKVIQLTEHVSLHREPDTFSRNGSSISDVKSPVSPKKNRATEQKEERESVWDDPKVKELLEKHRMRFMKKQNDASQQPATATPL